MSNRPIGRDPPNKVPPPGKGDGFGDQILYLFFQGKNYGKGTEKPHLIMSPPGGDRFCDLIMYRAGGGLICFGGGGVTPSLVILCITGPTERQTPLRGGGEISRITTVSVVGLKSRPQQIIAPGPITSPPVNPASKVTRPMDLPEGSLK